MKMHAFENKHDHEKGFLTAGHEKVGISEVQFLRSFITSLKHPVSDLLRMKLELFFSISINLFLLILTICKQIVYI